MVVQQLRISKLENARPNIMLKSIDEAFLGSIVTRQIDSLSGRLIEKPEHPYFTRIWVANAPLKPIQSVDATKLYGEITFYDNEGRELFVMGGRWAQTKEIADGGQPIEINSVDLPPNSMPFCLDIGLKYHGEDDFYGYNNETPGKNTYGFRDADRKLGKGNYYVGVRFRCKGVDKVFWFQLTNSGAGQDVSFVEIVEPSCLNVVGHRT